MQIRLIGEDLNHRIPAQKQLPRVVLPRVSPRRHTEEEDATQAARVHLKLAAGLGSLSRMKLLFLSDMIDARLRGSWRLVLRFQKAAEAR